MRERLLTSTGEDEVRGSLGKRQVVSGEGEGVKREDSPSRWTPTPPVVVRPDKQPCARWGSRAVTG